MGFVLYVFFFHFVVTDHEQSSGEGIPKKTPVKPPTSSMCYQLILVTLDFCFLTSFKLSTDHATTAGNRPTPSCQGQIWDFWNVSSQWWEWWQNGCPQGKISARPREDHNWGPERVAGREGDGGGVGEPRINSDKKQVPPPSYADTNGIEPTLIWALCGYWMLDFLLWWKNHFCLFVSPIIKHLLQYVQTVGL